MTTPTVAEIGVAIKEAVEGGRTTIPYKLKCEKEGCTLGMLTNRICGGCSKVLHDACSFAELPEADGSVPSGQNTEEMYCCTAACLVKMVDLRKTREKNSADGDAEVSGAVVVSATEGEFEGASENAERVERGERDREHDGVMTEVEDVDVQTQPEDGKRDGGNTHIFDDYRTVRMFTDIRNITIPAYQVRDLNLGHVALLKSALQKRGYRPEIGILSVSLKCAGCRGKSTIEEHECIELNGMELNLVDGLHRFKALLELIEEDHEWVTKCEKMKCLFWYVEQGRCLPDLDNIRIGSHLNDATGLSMKSSVRDHVFTAVSVVRIVREQRGLEWKDMTSEVVRLIFTESRCIGGQKIRQLSRYARLACRIAPSQDLFNSFLEAYDISNGKLGLVHVSHTMLLTSPDPVMKFSMKALGIRMGAMKSGRFDDFADMFFETARSLYGEVERVALMNRRNAEEVMRSPCRLGEETIDMEMFCMAKFAKVMYNEAGEVMRKQKRVKDLTKKLLKCGFTVVETPPVKTPPPQQQEQQQPLVAVDNDMDSNIRESQGPGGPPMRRQRRNGPFTVDRTNIADTQLLERAVTRKVPLPVGDLSVLKKQQTGVVSDGPETKETRKISGVAAKSMLFQERDDTEAGGHEEVLVSTKRASSRCRHHLAKPSGEEEEPAVGRLRTAAATKKMTSTKGSIKPVPVFRKEDPTAVVDIPQGTEHGVGSTKGTVQNDSPAAQCPPVPLIMEGVQDEVCSPSAGTHSAGGVGYSAFEDHVSDKVPHGVREGMSVDRIEIPDEKVDRLMRCAPTQWERLEFPGVSAKLLGGHVPLEHRAHLIMDDKQLRVLHHRIFWQASFNDVLKDFLWKDDFILEEINMPTSASEDDQKWAVALAEEHRATRYFANAAQQVRDVGFTVLAGFLADHLLPSGIPISKKNGNFPGSKERGEGAHSHTVVDIRETYADGHNLEQLMQYVQSKFPGQEDRSKVALADLADPFVYVVNQGEHEDLADAKEGEGRYSTTRYGVMDMLENEEAGNAWEWRSLLDVRIAMCVRFMGIGGGGMCFGKRTCIPKTGGRFIATTRGCRRQVIHCVGHHLPFEEVVAWNGFPGLFTICTFHDETPVWLCRYSHYTVPQAWLLGEARTVNSLSQAVMVQKVFIPPWSILVARMDIQHAGASGRDYDIRNDTSWIYQMYMAPNGSELPDGLDVDHNFDPVFQEEAFFEMDAEDQFDIGKDDEED